jgi:hypothetical protein
MAMRGGAAKTREGRARVPTAPAAAIFQEIAPTWLSQTPAGDFLYRVSSRLVFDKVTLELLQPVKKRCPTHSVSPMLEAEGVASAGCATATTPSCTRYAILMAEACGEYVELGVDRSLARQRS